MDEFYRWLLSSAGTAVLLGGALWFGRNLFITRLTSSVSHEYDEKLANINADLTAQESEMIALRSGALSGIANREKILYEHRVKAVEELWNNVLILAPAKKTSSTILAIPYDTILEMSEKDPKIQEMFKMIDGGQEENKELSFFNVESAYKARPFLSELSWSLFTAYSSILSTAVLRMELIKTGIKIDLINIDSVLDIVKTALPHHTTYIDKYGVDVLHYLLEELEQSILKELKQVLDGREADAESIERSTAINESIKKVIKESIQ